jgi:hypothetical protein
METLVGGYTNGKLSNNGRFYKATMVIVATSLSP